MIAPIQVTKLADYSQKEIQRQDGQMNHNVTLLVGPFASELLQNYDPRNPISMLRLQIHCNLTYNDKSLEPYTKEAEQFYQL